MAEENTKSLENEEELDEENDNQENNQQSEDNSGNDNQQDDDKKKSTEKTFSQTQVNKMMTREKNQGRNAALKELGIDPKNKEQVKAVQAFIASQKTDEQKALEKEQETNQQIQEANNRAAKAEAKAEAMQMGVKSEFVDDIVTLALAKLSDDTDLKTIIGEFKTKYSTWFIASDDDDNNKNVGNKGTGTSVKKVEKGGKNKEAQGIGARLAAQRKSSSKKSSYWSK